MEILTTRTNYYTDKIKVKKKCRLQQLHPFSPLTPLSNKFTTRLAIEQKLVEGSLLREKKSFSFNTSFSLGSYHLLCNSCNVFCHRQMGVE